MKPQVIKYALMYGDDSGVEYGVTYCEPSQTVTIEAHGGPTEIPVDKLDWLLEALNDIAGATKEKS